jgi:hypothetical protein
VEHIRGHLWYRYSIAVNQVMVATVKFSKWWLQFCQKWILGSVASLLAATLYEGNPDRNHKLWNKFKWPPVFSGVRVTRSVVFFVFCRSLFVLSYFFFWSLCCLFFFDLPILINLVVYSSSSYKGMDGSCSIMHTLWRGLERLWVLQHISQNIFLQSLQIAQIEIRLHDAHLGAHSIWPKNNKRS